MRRATAFAPFALALVLGLGTGCASATRLIAPNDDYADYRRVRLAATMGERLRAAEQYLRDRPTGAFADEIRSLWATDEPHFFEMAKASREATLEYLTALPRGPHADAATSLLAAWDTRIEEGEGAALLRDARRTEALLAGAAIQRQAVGDAIFDALRALADVNAYDRSLDDAPRPLRRFLTGAEGPTWGRMPERTTRDLFFVVPSQLERESRLAMLTLSVRVVEGLVRGGRVSGPDLFVHWLEADSMVALDPTNPDHRARAGRHATERLDGFFEALLPKRRCSVNTDARTGEALLVRECDGWTLSVTRSRAGGEGDAVTLVRAGAGSW